MSLQTFLTLVDRVGTPLAILVVLGVLTMRFIEGPANRLVDLVAAPFVELAKAGTAYIGAASAALSALTGHVSSTADEVRREVRDEGTKVRQHVSDAVLNLEQVVTGRYPGARVSQLPPDDSQPAGAPPALGRAPLVTLRETPPPRAPLPSTPA